MENEMLEAYDDLKARLQFVIDWADKAGHLEEHCFTFPDGETWHASQNIGSESEAVR